MDRTSSRNRHRSVSALCKPQDLILCCVCRIAREAVSQQIPPELWKFRRRQEPRQTTETGWTRGVASSPRYRRPPDDALSTTHQVWSSRAILQMIWRWRRVQDPATVLSLHPIDTICERLILDGDETLVILRTNCFLIMAMALGHRNSNNTRTRFPLERRYGRLSGLGIY